MLSGSAEFIVTARGWPQVKATVTPRRRREAPAYNAKALLFRHATTIFLPHSAIADDFWPVTMAAMRA